MKKLFTNKTFLLFGGIILLGTICICLFSLTLIVYLHFQNNKKDSFGEGSYEFISEYVVKARNRYGVTSYIRGEIIFRDLKVDNDVEYLIWNIVDESGDIIGDPQEIHIDQRDQTVTFDDFVDLVENRNVTENLYVEVYEYYEPENSQTQNLRTLLMNNFKPRQADSQLFRLIFKNTFTKSLNSEVQFLNSSDESSWAEISDFITLTVKNQPTIIYDKYTEEYTIRFEYSLENRTEAPITDISMGFELKPVNPPSNEYFHYSLHPGFGSEIDLLKPNQSKGYNFTFTFDPSDKYYSLIEEPKYLGSLESYFERSTNKFTISFGITNSSIEGNAYFIGTDEFVFD